jgi:hypothetical protein
MLLMRILKAKELATGVLFDGLTVRGLKPARQPRRSGESDKNGE